MAARQPEDLVGRLRARLMDLPEYNEAEENGVTLGEEILEDVLQDALEDFNIETCTTTYKLTNIPARSMLLDYAVARALERLIFKLAHNDVAFANGGDLMYDSSRKIQVFTALMNNIFAKAAQRTKNFKTRNNINAQLVTGFSIR